MNLISNNKNQGIETIRFIAIFFVIILHTAPFAYPTIKIGADLSLSTLIVNLSRFAVPVFFIISGFFWLKNWMRHHRLIYSY